MNLQVALGLLIQLLGQADAIGRLIDLAHKEGRDITDAELDDLVISDEAAKLALQKSIDAKKSSPGGG